MRIIHIHMNAEILQLIDHINHFRIPCVRTILLKCKSKYQYTTPDYPNAVTNHQFNRL